MNESISTLTCSSQQLPSNLIKLAHSLGIEPDTPKRIKARDPALLASYAGLEAISLSRVVSQLHSVLCNSPAVLLQLELGSESVYVLLRKIQGQRLQVYSSGGNVTSMSVNGLLQLLEQFTGLDDQGQNHRTEHSIRITGIWSLAPSPSLPITTLFRAFRLTKYFLGFVIGRVLERILYVASWWLLGRAVLTGQFESSILISWLLLLASASFSKFSAGWCHIQFSMITGVVLKKKIQSAVLQQHPDRIRRFGAGQLLGRSLESDALVTDTLAGVFTVLLCLIDLVIVAAIFIAIANYATLLVLVFFLVASGLLWWRYYVALNLWSLQRIKLSEFMIEQISGHHTRQVQQNDEAMHEEEDQYLDEYHSHSLSMDRYGVKLDSLLPYGWLLLASLTLFLPLVQGAPSTLLAAAIGAILLAWRALQLWVPGGKQLCRSLTSWQYLKPLFSAPEALEAPTSLCHPAAGKPLLAARRINYRHDERTKPTLDELNFTIHTGDRIMLTGASGAGKSTLCATITGIRNSNAGQFLLHGSDCRTIANEERRQRLCLVPQFQDNHIFSGSLAFNLLLGRSWPPDQDDLRRAYTLCEELGLITLLEKMPAGMFQPVGEMGWNLSHGERSRVFIARALLQGADLLIFDESLSALDPETLTLSLECLERHADSFLLCAHP